MKAIDGWKRCAKCDEVKPVEAFSRSRHAADNLQAYCRTCANANKAFLGEGFKTMKVSVDPRAVQTRRRIEELRERMEAK
jgi:L-alanine-DL-glutamate epimerase-like enolase superfamily enzyme